MVCKGFCNGGLSFGLVYGTHHGGHQYEVEGVRLCIYCKKFYWIWDGNEPKDEHVRCMCCGELKEGGW